ncbi:hypothetical protein GBA52_015247 [Prunus armeniaca]|nr:hypothetical protein GBA52_015247 [Prunus armeniaca]
MPTPIVRVRAEKSSIGRLGKRLTTPSILAEFELASPKNQGSMSPEKRALEEQREAEQRKGGGGGKVGQPTIPIDGDPDPLRVIPPSTPSSQPTIVLDRDGSTEKDREVDTTGMVPRIREFCVGSCILLDLDLHCIIYVCLHVCCCRPKTRR